MHRMHLLRRTTAILAVTLLLAACLAGAAPAETSTLEFAPGTTSTTVEGAVIRGESNTYTLSAQAGQTLVVEISSLEANAVFSILAPGPGEAFLSGAGEGEDVMAYTGVLVNSGEYRITVGAMRGGAEYSLSVELKD